MNYLYVIELLNKMDNKLLIAKLKTYTKKHTN